MTVHTLPGACSPACHVSPKRSGLPFEVDAQARDAIAFLPFPTFDPAGAVPAR